MKRRTLDIIFATGGLLLAAVLVALGAAEGIAIEAHELTRKTRQGLDAIGDEVRAGNRRTTQVAEAARRAVDVARNEITVLNAATIEQTRQMENTIKRINDLQSTIASSVPLARTFDCALALVGFTTISSPLLVFPTTMPSYTSAEGAM